MAAETTFELTNEDWECLRRAWSKGLNYAVRVVNAGRSGVEGVLDRDQLVVLARSAVGDILARAGCRFLLLREGDPRGVEVTALLRQLLLTRDGISMLESIALRLVALEPKEALRLLREGLSGQGGQES